MSGNQGPGNLSIVNSITQFVNASQATWNSITIPIPAGMVVYASDTQAVKMGDGATLYAQLPTLFTFSQITSLASQNTTILAQNATITTNIAALNATVNALTTANFTSPAIVGGTANGMVIGGSTPAAGAFTTLRATGVINTTSTSGFQIGGVTVVNLYGGNNSTLALGRNSGLAAIGTVGTFSTYCGDSSGMNTLASASENTMFGSNAGAFNISGGQNTYLGCVAGRTDQTSDNVYIGCDSGRDVVSVTGSNTAVGQNSQRSGGGDGNTSIGEGALQGNSAAIIFSGTQTTGDVVTLIFNAPASTLWGGYAALVNASVSVTVTAGMTSAQLTTAMIAAITANTTIGNAMGGTQAYTGSAANAIRFSFAGTATTGAQCIITSNVTGAATEVVTITGGSMGGSNVAVGLSALNGVGLTNASFNVAVGAEALQYLVTGNGNVALGHSSGQMLISGAGNVLAGIFAGQSLTTPNDNVAIGDNALAVNITGASNTAVGAFAMANNVLAVSNASVNSTALGYGALKGAVGSTSTAMVALGGNAGFNVTTAANCVLAGFNAGLGLTTGFSSVIIGRNTGASVTTGFNNTIIGTFVSANTLTTGFGNIIIGAGGTASTLDTASSSTSNTINIGNIWTATGTNTPATAITSIAGFITQSTATGLTAHAGGGQASALLLTSMMNFVATVATTADSVKLPVSVAGLEIVITNGGSNSLQVFGSGTDTINTIATGTGVAIAAGKTGSYVCYTPGTWFGGVLS